MACIQTDIDELSNEFLKKELGDPEANKLLSTVQEELVTLKGIYERYSIDNPISDKPLLDTDRKYVQKTYAHLLDHKDHLRDKFANEAYLEELKSRMAEFSLENQESELGKLAKSFAWEQSEALILILSRCDHTLIKLKEVCSYVNGYSIIPDAEEILYLFTNLSIDFAKDFQTLKKGKELIQFQTELCETIKLLTISETTFEHNHELSKNPTYLEYSTHFDHLKKIEEFYASNASETHLYEQIGKLQTYKDLFEQHLKDAQPAYQKLEELMQTNHRRSSFMARMEMMKETLNEFDKKIENLPEEDKLKCNILLQQYNESKTTFLSLEEAIKTAETPEQLEKNIDHLISTYSKAKAFIVQLAQFMPKPENKPPENESDPKDRLPVDKDENEVKKQYFLQTYNLLTDTITMLQVKRLDLLKQAKEQEIKVINSHLQKLNGLRRGIELEAYGFDLFYLRKNIRFFQRACIKNNTSNARKDLANANAIYRQIIEAPENILTDLTDDKMQRFLGQFKNCVAALDEEMQKTIHSQKNKNARIDLSFWFTRFKEKIADGLTKIFTNYRSINPFDVYSSLKTTEIIHTKVDKRLSKIKEKFQPESTQNSRASANSHRLFGDRPGEPTLSMEDFPEESEVNDGAGVGMGNTPRPQ